METATHVRQTDQPVSTGSALLTVLLPGKLDRQVRAAAALPLWLTVLIALCLIPVIIETCTFTGNVIDSLDNPGLGWPDSGVLQHAVERTVRAASNHFRLNALRELTYGVSAPVSLVLATLLGALAGLEVLNVMILAPYAASWGDRFMDAARRTRKVMFALGTAWALHASLAWTVLSLIACTGILAVAAIRQIRNLEFFMIVGAGFCLSFSLLLLWMLRLIRAAGMMVEGHRPLPAQRCSGCGYLLEGLAEDAGCPECGLARPGQVDEDRQPAGWTRRRGHGRLANLLWLSTKVTFQPAEVFGKIRLLDDPLSTRWFLGGVLGLSLLSWVPAIPGFAVEMAGRNGMRWLYAGAGSVAALAFGLFFTLCALVVVGLLILLIGWRIGRARQEPSWAIAANATCHLAACFPWVFAIEALWLLPFSLWDLHAPSGERARDFSRFIAWAMSVDSDFVYGTLMVLPGILALGLVIRAAVVCYRHVRYACR